MIFRVSGERGMVSRTQASFPPSYLLHGPPGNGKTSAIRAMMSNKRGVLFLVHSIENHFRVRAKWIQFGNFARASTSPTGGLTALDIQAVSWAIRSDMEPCGRFG